MSNKKFLKHYEKKIETMINKNNTSKNENESKKNEQKDEILASANLSENLLDDYIFNLNYEQSLSDIIDENAIQIGSNIRSNTETYNRGGEFKHVSQTDEKNTGSNVNASYTKLIFVE